MHISISEFIRAQTWALTRILLMPSLNTFPAKWCYTVRAFNRVNEDIFAEATWDDHHVARVPLVHFFYVNTSVMVFKSVKIVLASAFYHRPTTPTHILRKGIAVYLNIGSIIVIIRGEFNNWHVFRLWKVIIGSSLVHINISPDILHEFLAIVNESPHDAATVVGSGEKHLLLGVDSLEDVFVWGRQYFVVVDVRVAHGVTIFWFLGKIMSIDLKSYNDLQYNKLLI